LAEQTEEKHEKNLSCLLISEPTSELGTTATGFKSSDHLTKMLKFLTPSRDIPEWNLTNKPAAATNGSIKLVNM
jgi:hypothetical protein